ncbi:MAG: rRNA pseudouridine synthase [Nitrospirota bacterium]|nr:MAG: rRNA pseudouridine synthase [Nitrospirota bacterium]
MQERIQKIISSAGIASRRKAEELIKEGKVKVNGVIATLGMKADPLKDHIKIGGRLITKREKAVYFILNKPVGVLTTLADPEGRSTLSDYISRIKERIYPVGRLDYRSEGLILLTNDGALADALMHPSRKVPKVYRVKVRGIPEDDKLVKLRKGIKLDDGMTMPAKISKAGITRKHKNSWLNVTIHEGRNRQVRRMFEKIGHPVLKLKRTAIDGIKLGTLRTGDIRKLSRDEVMELKENIGIKKA